MGNETEGIVLRKTKTTKGRTMVTLFTKDLGKIGAGTSIGERAKGKGASAINVFTHGSYRISQSSWGYSISTASTIKSFFDISTDMDKFGYASYAIEITDKAFIEGVVNVNHFHLLVNFLDMLERRKQGISTVFIGYMLRTLAELGVKPQFYQCSRSGKKVEGNEDQKWYLSISDGGLVCGDSLKEELDSNLIFPVGIDIINIVLYCLENPIKSLEKVAIKDDYERAIRGMVIAYSEYHLALGKLNSKEFLPR